MPISGGEVADDEVKWFAQLQQLHGIWRQGEAGGRKSLAFLRRSYGGIMERLNPAPKHALDRGGRPSMLRQYQSQTKQTEKDTEQTLQPT